MGSLKAELKNFRRYILFKVHRELKKSPSTAKYFVEELRNLTKSTHEFTEHFERTARERASWPLISRIKADELDYDLFSPLGEMLHFESPRSLSEGAARFVEALLSESRLPEAGVIVDLSDALRDCDDAFPWGENGRSTLAIWPWVATKALFAANTSCPEKNDSRAVAGSMVELALYGIKSKCPDTVRCERIKSLLALFNFEEI